MSDRPMANTTPEESLAPARNFTIPLEQRVAALGGPPAYVRRRREIEDLEASYVARVVEAARRATTADGRAALEAAAVAVDLTRINDLIERHNRYYPIEANLPIDRHTGALIERVGHPFVPLETLTVARLVALAHAALGGTDAS